MSSKPSAAKYSASARVATVTPAAPCWRCRAAICAVLWVLACGHRATPALRARSAIAATLAISTSRSTTSAGVASVRREPAGLRAPRVDPPSASPDRIAVQCTMSHCMLQPASLPYISAAEVERLLPYGDAVDELRMAFGVTRGDTPERVRVEVPGGELLLMPALGREGVGVKLVTLHAHDP